MKERPHSGRLKLAVATSIASLCIVGGSVLLLLSILFDITSTQMIFIGQDTTLYLSSSKTCFSAGIIADFPHADGLDSEMTMWLKNMCSCPTNISKTCEVFEPVGMGWYLGNVIGSINIDCSQLVSDSYRHRALFISKWVTAIVGLILATCGALLGWPIIRILQRKRRRLCIKCGYILDHLPTKVCPECGSFF